MLFSFQGDPDVTNKAAEVIPNSDKLDLRRFYQDLPKYMPYLSPRARENWEQFESSNPTSLIAADSLKWELPALYSAAILSSQLQVSVEHISSETATMLDKEVATPKQVSFIDN